ncbi:unnamed protein product [Urochloa humidicola]
MGGGRKQLLVLLLSLGYYMIPSFFTVQHCAAAVVPEASDSDAKTGKQIDKEDELVVVSRSTSKNKEIYYVSTSAAPEAPPRDHKGKDVVTSQKPKRRRKRGKKHRIKSVTGTPSAAREEAETSSMKWSDRVTKNTDEKIADQFYKFLEEFIETGELKRFYEEQMKSMKERKALVMDIFYRHLEKTNLRLAMALCNNYRRLEFRLKHMVGKFIKVLMPCVPDSVCQSLSLMFHEMPRRHQRLIDILNDNTFIEPEEVYGCSDQVFKLTKVGSQLWRAGFAYMLRAHLAGVSWFGKFNLNNIEVKNGDGFFIRIKPLEHTPEGALLDLQHFFKEMIPHFSKNGVMPPYFEQLKKFLLITISKDVLEKPSSLKRFRKYLLNHLALAAPLRRAHLIGDIHRCCKMMDDDKHRDMPFKNLLRRFSNSNWQKVVTGDVELNKVYTFKPKHLRVQNSTRQSRSCNVHNSNVQNPSEKLLVNEVVFDDTLESMAMFLRHFSEHALDNSKKKPPRPARLLNSEGEDCSSTGDEIKGVQQAKKLDEYELLTAIRLGTEIAEMIWYLMLYTGFEGILEGVWEAYMCMDDVDDYDF